MKPCVDDKLDDLKRRQNGLPDLLNVVTEEEIARFENKYRCGEEKKELYLSLVQIFPGKIGG